MLFVMAYPGQSLRDGDILNIDVTVILIAGMATHPACIMSRPINQGTKID